MVQSRKMVRCALALVASCVLGVAQATDTQLVAHYTFDDAANPLAATVGSAATVVNYTKNSVTAVEGLGNCALVTDSNITTGLASGSGALTIPLGQALRIAHGIPTDQTRPWCISMRFYLPPNESSTDYNSLLSTYQNAEGDAALCIRRYSATSYAIGGGNDNETNWGYTPISCDAWHVITVSMDNSLIELYLDGALLIRRTCGLDEMRVGRLTLKNRPYLFIAGDEDGEDAPLHFDWVKIYNVARPQAIFPSRQITYTFDDAADPLAATGGAEATVVNYTKNSVTAVEGLGNCALVTDPAVTAGLESGSGALTIPFGQALRIQHGIPIDRARPWCISMRVYLPPNKSATAYNSLLSTYQNAEGDAALCIKRFSETNYGIGGGNDNETSWGYTTISCGAWHVITVSCDDYAMRLIVDGVVIQDKASSIAEMRGGRWTLVNRPYLFIAGDEDGEDAPLHFDWIKVYDTAVPDDLIVRTAVWTGGGDVDNPADALNWTVLDENDATVVNGVPDAFTELFLSGPTTLNVPRLNGFRCGRVRLEGTVSLSGDADWRGLGTAPFVGQGVIDLNGHRLAVSSLRSIEAEAARVTNGAAGGPVEFVVDVPSGFRERNSQISLDGNFKFVKAGTGTFVAGLSYQTYSGGTLVSAGSFICGLSPAQGVCGQMGTPITVDTNTVFDLWGHSGLESYPVTLNGGTLTTTLNSSITSHDWTLGNLTLTADSRITFADFGEKDTRSHDVRVVSGSVWNLGGHVLDIAFAGTDPDFYTSMNDSPRRLVLTNGTIRASGPGWFHDHGIDGREGGRLDLDNILRLQLPETIPNSDIQDFAVRGTYTTANVASTGRLRVWGTFTPLSRYCFQVELENGSTLNLADHASAWPIAFENGIVTAFANGAEVTLGLGTRTFREPTRVVAWETAPANIASLSFKVEEGLQDVYGVTVRTDGVYVWPRQGIVITVR